MTAGLIGVGFADLGFEHTYNGPYNNALYNKLYDFIEELNINDAITGASEGSETIWAWVAMEIPLKLTCLLSCSSFGNFWDELGKEKLHTIKMSSDVKVVTLGSGGETYDKTINRDKILIDRSDLVFIVISGIGIVPSRYMTAINHAKKLDKEIILIKTNELL